MTAAGVVSAAITHRGLSPDGAPADHHELQGLCRAPECRASGAIALALTVQQPWAAAIAYGDKRTENRVWPIPPKHVGARVLIHAGQQADQRAVLPAEHTVPRQRLDHRGVVLAAARLASCHQATTQGPLCCAPWGFPSTPRVTVWHWRLEDVQALDLPIEARGAQKLWRPPADLVRAVRSQLAGAPYAVLEEAELC